MHTGNPALSDKRFEQTFLDPGGPKTMSVQGTVNKSFILGGLLLVTAIFSWNYASPKVQIPTTGIDLEALADYAGKTISSPEAWGLVQDGLITESELLSWRVAPKNVMPLMWGSMIVGFILAMICIFKPQTSPIVAPMYAIAEGAFLGAISCFYEMRYGGGLAMQAAVITICILLGLLMAYTARLIKVTERFRSIVVVATMGVALVYLVSIIGGFLGFQIPYLHASSHGGSSAIGIGVSLFIVGLASANLLLDFDVIERSVQRGAPRYMEWYGAFGLMVTLVWLYLELLRLLAKLRER